MTDTNSNVQATPAADANKTAEAPKVEATSAQAEEAKVEEKKV